MPIAYSREHKWIHRHDEIDTCKVDRPAQIKANQIVRTMYIQYLPVRRDPSSGPIRHRHDGIFELYPTNWRQLKHCCLCCSQSARWHWRLQYATDLHLEHTQRLFSGASAFWQWAHDSLTEVATDRVHCSLRLSRRVYIKSVRYTNGSARISRTVSRLFPLGVTNKDFVFVESSSFSRPSVCMVCSLLSSGSLWI
jgi:hypothetical protein